MGTLQCTRNAARVLDPSHLHVNLSIVHKRGGMGLARQTNPMRSRNEHVDDGVKAALVAFLFLVLVYNALRLVCG